MTGSGLTRLGLRIEPLDTLFFRDGRPFGPATRAGGGLPLPQGLAGALRTSLLAASGFDFAGFAERRKVRPDDETGDVLAELGVADWLISARFRGPWLMREPATGPHELLFAMPANLFRDNQTRLWYRADPLEGDLPGWTPGRPGSRPLWRRGGPDAKRPDGFLTCQGMTRYLEGNLPEDLDTVQRSEVFEFDDRTGLEIDADTLTGVEGRLYARQFLVLKHGVGFYAEIMVPADVDGAIRGLLAKAPVFPWGGEGRFAAARLLTAPVSWPSVESGGMPLRLLASPGLFGTDPGSGREVPDRIDPDRLVAIASTRAVAVSGWDVAR
ncbi:MAG: type III-B CRISPR module-associated Cmr3 family protein, partial [Isosphaeraceae bacterium]